MDEPRCHTRICTPTNTHYMVVETVAEIVDQIDSATDADPWVSLTSRTGQDLFPPERLVLRAKDIVLMQEMSEPGWFWAKRATELHYARQLEDLEQAPAKQMVEVQKRLVSLLEGDDDE